MTDVASVPRATTLRTRSLDVSLVVLGAAAATAGLCTLFHRPTLLLGLIALLIPLFVLRWHAPRDLIGLGVGATLGNLTELVCDVGGVWVHATGQILDVAPAYIFACYPILGITVPRLVDALAGRVRGRAEASGLLAATLLWGGHVALSFRFGTDNTAELIVSAACLALTLLRFHALHDLITAAFGVLLAMVWELPCTFFGAWRFPHPQLFGLIPLWLALAYAVFFVNLGRITAALHAAAGSRPAPRRP